jgi:excisionase family DNA binding protein
MVRMPHTDIQRRLMTVDQVAEYLGVSRRSVQRWIAEGVLPAYQLGRRKSPVRIDAAELQRWLEDEGAL